jgi:uncharacterized protein (TIGR03067 family)
MKARSIAALLALAGLTGFAPAPLPRQTRHGDPNLISVATFQGKWRVAGMVSTRRDGKHQPYTWQVTHVRVEGKTWTFLDKQGATSASYTITIDNARKPAAYLDFWNGDPQPGGSPPGCGIIRKRGGLVEIIYVFGAGGKTRPASFDQPPDSQYLLTLERTR